MRGKKKKNLKPVCSHTRSKKLFGSFFKRKVKPAANPANPQAHVDAPIPEVNPVQDGNPPPVQNRFLVSDKPQANAKHLVDSIRVLVPEQLGLLSEGDENFDETVAFNKVEEIGRNLMKFIYVAQVLHWWVLGTCTLSYFYFEKFETGDMLELARSMLYIPPTETEAETAFLFKNGCFPVGERL